MPIESWAPQIKTSLRPLQLNYTVTKRIGAEAQWVKLL